MDIWQRRGLLGAVNNPERKIDYVSQLGGAFIARGVDQRVTLRVRYIPDKLILLPERFESYLQHVETLDMDTLEALAALILTDVSNELVARWVELKLTGAPVMDALTAHEIIMEDRQPGWDNDRFLARLHP